MIREDDGTDQLVYTLGADVIAQASTAVDETPKYFLYDGHGSVRHLTEYDNDGQAPDTNGDVLEDYHFDAYGKNLWVAKGY